MAQATIFPGGADYPDSASFARTRYEPTRDAWQEDSPDTPYLRSLADAFTGATPPDDASFAGALAHVEHAGISRDVTNAPGLLAVASALRLDVANEKMAHPMPISHTGISPTSRWCASMEVSKQQLAATCG